MGTRTPRRDGRRKTAPPRKTALPPPIRPPVNVAEYEAIARERMDPAAFDFYAGGAGDERTLAMNLRGFDRYALRPRVLVDVSHVDTSTIVLGERLTTPILIAPTALQRLAHPEGERATARAAAAAGTIMCVSTVASVSIEDVAAAAGGSLWFQLYVYRDPGITRAMVARAEAAGYRALVVTVDVPRLGTRERDVRNAFALPRGVDPVNLTQIHPLVAARDHELTPFVKRVDELFDASLDWKKIEWIRSITRMPVILKGVLTPEDARLAADAGVAAIIVSNHGGRQLDGAEASIVSLPRVVDAVAGAMPVLVDGGIRRGAHVLTALALGAQAVLIGRPVLWGLAAGGEQGVRDVLEMLRAELELAMVLSGKPSIASIDRSLVAEA
jgi:4-hydroxymandelate oxidase